jgi:hypothetical protein
MACKQTRNVDKIKIDKRCGVGPDSKETGPFTIVAHQPLSTELMLYRATVPLEKIGMMRSISA